MSENETPDYRITSDSSGDLYRYDADHCGEIDEDFVLPGIGGTLERNSDGELVNPGEGRFLKVEDDSE